MNHITVLLLIIIPQSLFGDDFTLGQQLVIASYKLDLEGVVACLRNGADVNATMGRIGTESDLFRNPWTGAWQLGVDSWTPLIAVASAPEYPDPPADVNEVWKDQAKSRELRRAITRDVIEKRRSKALSILFILLSHQCKLDNDDGYGATALFKAVEDQKQLMVRALLRFGANPNTKTGVYIDGPSDITPLHVSCGSRAVIQLLLDHGADGDSRDSDGRTPADWVAFDSDREFDLVKTDNGWRVRDRDAIQGDCTIRHFPNRTCSR